MKIKYLQLVEHTEPFFHYGLHEALMEIGEQSPYWVGSKPIRKYDNYKEAMLDWGLKDAGASSNMDILCYNDIEELVDRVDYSEEETELNFD